MSEKKEGVHFVQQTASTYQSEHHGKTKKRQDLAQKRKDINLKAIVEMEYTKRKSHCTQRRLGKQIPAAKGEVRLTNKRSLHK